MRGVRCRPPTAWSVKEYSRLTECLEPARVAVRPISRERDRIADDQRVVLPPNSSGCRFFRSPVGFAPVLIAGRNVDLVKRCLAAWPSILIEVGGAASAEHLSNFRRCARCLNRGCPCRTEGR